MRCREGSSGCDNQYRDAASHLYSQKNRINVLAVGLEGRMKPFPRRLSSCTSQWHQALLYRCLPVCSIYILMQLASRHGFQIRWSKYNDCDTCRHSSAEQLYVSRINYQAFLFIFSTEINISHFKLCIFQLDI